MPFGVPGANDLSYSIAISLSTFDLEFADRIGDMLEQISYIDDCDTLGQKAEREDVHKVFPTTTSYPESIFLTPGRHWYQCTGSSSNSIASHLTS